MTSAQTQADKVIDQASQGAHEVAREVARDWREHAAPMMDDMADRASDLAHEGVGWARDNSKLARRKLKDASDRSLSYARQKPARTAITVMAAGVLVYGVWRLLSPRKGR